jgi:hypothetical protein
MTTPKLDLAKIRKQANFALLYVSDHQHWFHQVLLLCDEVERLRKAMRDVAEYRLDFKEQEYQWGEWINHARDTLRKALES